MTAASRQSGVEGPDGSAGLKVMPIDSVTLSDGYDPRERAPTRLCAAIGCAFPPVVTTHNRVICVAHGRGRVLEPDEKGGTPAKSPLAAGVPVR